MSTLAAPQQVEPARAAPDLSASDSRRLELLKFPLIVLVVMIHAYEPVVALADGRSGYTGGLFSHWLRFFVSQGLGRVAVPLFYLMAGFFLFLGWDGGRAGLWSRWQSRWRSLAVPFLLWNLLALLLLLLAQELALFAPLVSGHKERLTELSALGWLNTLVGLDQRPAAYQFWFIRDLMLLVLLAPLLRPLLVRGGPGLLLVGLLALLWIFNLWWLYLPAIEALFFFVLGALLACRGISPFVLDRFAGVAAPLYLGSMALLAALPWQPGYLIGFRLALMLGVITTLACTAWVARQPRLGLLLSALGPASFFVFAAHEPLLTVLRKLSFRLVPPDSQAMLLLLYFAVPACTVLLALAARQVLARWSPALLRTLSGGR